MVDLTDMAAALDEERHLVNARHTMLTALRVIELNLSLHGKLSEAELRDLYLIASSAIAKAEGRHQ